MKRKLFVILASVMLFTMSGCVEKIDLDEEQEAKFIGYSVYAVLEHDKNYMIGLNTVEDSADDSAEPSTDSQQGTTEPGTQNPTGGENNGETGNSGSTATTVSMDEALAIDGISVRYKNFEVCDIYPKSDGTPVFTIKAYSGHKLVVLKFDMTNTTDADMNVDIHSKDFIFKGIFNKSIKTNAHITLLPEAMNTYNSTIKAGETVETVLVFEMSDGYVTNLSDIQLEIKSESGSKSVKIQ